MTCLNSYNQLNGHEFEQILEDTEGQGSLVCCNPWGCKESRHFTNEQHFFHSKKELLVGTVPQRKRLIVLNIQIFCVIKKTAE